jgi:hypothetical protein
MVRTVRNRHGTHKPAYMTWIIKAYALFSVNWLFLLAVAIAKFAVFFLVLLIGRTLISCFYVAQPASYLTRCSSFFVESLWKACSD